MLAYIWDMKNAQNTAMTYANLTLDQVAAFFNEKVWNGSRVYLNAPMYKGGKRSKATCYMYIDANGQMAISVYVNCPGSYDYALQAKKSLLERISDRLADCAAELAAVEVAEVAAAEVAAEVAVAELIEEVNQNQVTMKINTDQTKATAQGALKFKSWTADQRTVIERIAADGYIDMTTAEMTAFDGIERTGDETYRVVLRNRIQLAQRSRKKDTYLLPWVKVAQRSTCNV